jgi:hypothetical protein
MQGCGMRGTTSTFAFKLTIVALLCCLLCPRLGAQDTDVLTNESVVALVKNGIGSDLIVKMIGEQPNHFELGSKGIIQLKREGVPQIVLRAMLDSHHPAAGDKEKRQETSVAPPAKQSKAPNYSWTLISKVDPMTGGTESNLVLDSPAVTEDGDLVGTFEAQASCDASQLSIHLMYLSDAKPGTGFKQNTTTYYETGGLFGAMANASHHKKAWTETRVRIGSLSPIIATSEADFLNESDLYFVDRDPNDTTQEGAGIAIFANMLTANKPAGLAENFFAAPRVLFESVFADGTKGVMEIHPQDPSFHTFADRCISIGSIGKKEVPAPPSNSSYEGSARQAEPGRRPSTPPPGPAPVRSVIVRGSTLLVTLIDPITLDTARSGALVHATLADAMQSPVADSGQKALPLPAGTEVYLVRVEMDHVVLRGVNVPVVASTPVRMVERARITVPSSFNLGRYGRVGVPQNSAAQANPTLVKRDERLTFTVSQASYAPASLLP